MSVYRIQGRVFLLRNIGSFMMQENRLIISDGAHSFQYHLADEKEAQREFQVLLDAVNDDDKKRQYDYQPQYKALGQKGRGK